MPVRHIYITETKEVTNNWGLVKKVVAPERAISDVFGESVSISGNYAVVSAQGEDEDEDDNNTLSSSGSAYIFSKDEGGTDNWGQVKKITASDRKVNALFGSSVSVSDDKLIVGARGEVHDAGGGDSLTNAGSIYIFSKDEGGIDNWGQIQKIAAPDRETPRWILDMLLPCPAAMR